MDFIKVHWNLKNFFFCNMYRNARFSTPEITIAAPWPSKWKLYLFPNGHGPENHVGIYLVRKKDHGPKKLTVVFKICLLDRNGEHSPVGTHQEKDFSENYEWGHDKFFKRSDLKPDSRFIADDGTLSIYCEFRVKDAESSVEAAADTARPDLEQYKDRGRIYKAMEFMYEKCLHSDMTLHGPGKRTYHAHKCILGERLPDLYGDLAIFPDRVYENNSATNAVLQYAYTGKLDFSAFDWWNTRAVLDTYGLASLDTQRSGLVQKRIVMNTYFFVNKQILSWKINRQLLYEKDEIHSNQVVDELNEIHFRAVLTKTDDHSWSPSIDVFSGDESFVKWKHFLDIDGPTAHLIGEGENIIGSRLSRIQCPSSMLSFPSPPDGTLTHRGDRVQLPGDSISLNFEIEYPMCETTSKTSRECSSESASSEPLDDTIGLLNSLEALYRRQAGDMAVKVPNSDRTFKVHKCILASRSRTFREMLELAISEERENEVITLKRPNNVPQHIFEDVVDKTFLYIYCGKMEVGEDQLMMESLKNYIDYCMVGD